MRPTRRSIRRWYLTTSISKAFMSPRLTRSIRAASASAALILTCRRAPAAAAWPARRSRSDDGGAPLVPAASPGPTGERQSSAPPDRHGRPESQQHGRLQIERSPADHPRCGETVPHRPRFEPPGPVVSRRRHGGSRRERSSAGMSAADAAAANTNRTASPSAGAGPTHQPSRLAAPVPATTAATMPIPRRSGRAKSTDGAAGDTGAGQERFQARLSGPLEHQASVRAAEAEIVLQRVVDPHVASAIGTEVQVAGRILIEDVDRGWRHLVVQGRAR